MTGVEYRAVSRLHWRTPSVRDPDFKYLSSQLLKKGIAARHARRTVSEMQDHYDDLLEAALDSGDRKSEARQKAAERLGDLDDFVAAMAARRDLKSWSFRYPRLAVVVYPLACLAVLPAAPVFAGYAHRDILMRWTLSLLGAGLVTALMMLVMQLTIVLG